MLIDLRLLHRAARLAEAQKGGVVSVTVTTPGLLLRQLRFGRKTEERLITWLALEQDTTGEGLFNAINELGRAR